MSAGPRAALLEIMDGVDGLDVDEGSKHLFRRLVLTVSAAHGINEVNRIGQIAYARRLLDLRVSRPTTRDRLIALYSISRRQAYRLIGEALELCQKRA